jgi:hypothetical protein
LLDWTCEHLSAFIISIEGPKTSKCRGELPFMVTQVPLPCKGCNKEREGATSTNTITMKYLGVKKKSTETTDHRPKPQ